MRDKERSQGWSREGVSLEVGPWHLLFGSYLHTRGRQEGMERRTDEKL